MSHLCADLYLLIPNALDFATNSQIVGYLSLLATLLTNCRTPVQLGVESGAKQDLLS